MWLIGCARMWNLDQKESLVPKNWCFWTVIWTKLLRVPWTAKRSNLWILKEINPEYSLQGLMLKLKLQYFGHLMWRSDSLEKTLMLGKIERRRRGQQRIRWLDGITNSMDMSLSNLQEMVIDREPWWVVVHRFTKCWTWLSNWTTIHKIINKDLWNSTRNSTEYSMITYMGKESEKIHICIYV